MPAPTLPQPPAPPNPLLTGVIDLATDKLLLRPLLNAAPEEYRELLSLYVPALRKFTETELFMFSRSVTDENLNQANQLLRSKMTGPELVTEKRELLKLTQKMANISSARIASRNAMLRSTMFAALKLAMMAAA